MQPLPAAPAAAPAVDVAALVELAEAVGPATVTEIVGLFLRDVRSRLRQMHAAAAGGNHEAMAELAHAIAGSAGSVGADGIESAARRLIAAPAAPGLLHALDRAVADGAGALGSFLAGQGG